jgi:hypothetical protein
MGRFDLVSAAGLMVAVGVAEATPMFATSVVNYVPGIISTDFQEAAAALGMPAGDTSFGVLTPFNGPFLGSHITGIGQGGSLTLALAATAPTGGGATLGVHAGVGLIDNDWPNGFAGAVATPYTNPRTSEVSVSDDGVRWHSLGTRTFAMPTNFYSHGIATPGYQADAGTQVANFQKPFTRPLSDFNTLDWPGILGVLDGSAGGDWLDLTSVPYPGVNYIRFEVNTAAGVMYVDAVAVIPEPGAMLLSVTLSAGVLLVRRGHRSIVD